MSNNSTTVQFSLNGKQAQEELEKLRQRADDLKKSLEEAYRTGTKESQQHFKKELLDTQKQLRQMESGVKAVERVFANLDKATPDELRRSLKFLTNELKNVERGSKVWNEHTEKIRRIKAELDKVNAELRQTESGFTRMKNTINDWGASIAAGAAAVAGLVAAGKQAVQAYAEMDQEMANVRKYTGMSAEQVEALNEEFKKMDTRTSREELNMLAQEAGRLGKTSHEDVLGFVKAADKINVALDDLGEGATLTLSKLTNIFGDEERLGTEQSLLAVGSVINELSQNCTASAPYLAEFAQRLAGVGAQAGMSIPEIMGFAAVLDSQGQKLEMSSTALSKIIMNLFKDPEKIARATGMAVQEFSETCKRSTNEGLLMLLNRLHELGGIDTLAPVFADMGENGARASAVLASLAGNIDMVKQQQIAANEAYAEATSINKEFNVQNTTVQAGLDKAKKAFTEMAVELGKELLPVMRGVISSTSAIMKGMSVVIKFAKEHKTAVLAVVAAIATYTVAVNLAIIKEKLHAALIATKTAGLHVLKVAVLAASAAYNGVTGNITRANAAMKLLNTTMKTNPWGLLASLIVSAGVALAGYIRNQREAVPASKALDDVRKTAAQNMVEETNKINLLVAAAKNEKLSLEERKKAVDKLNAIIPNYNAQLDATTGKYQANKQALDDYLEALRYKYELEGAKDKLAEIGRQKAEINIKKANQQKELEKLGKEREQAVNLSQNQSSTGSTLGDLLKQGGAMQASGYMTLDIDEDIQEAKGELEKLDGELQALVEQEGIILGEYGKGLMQEVAKFEEDTSTEVEVPVPVPTVVPVIEEDSSTNPVAPDPLKELEAEYQKKQAIEAYYYATGQKSYSEHLAEKKRLEKEYHEDRLALMTAGTTEYYQELTAIENQSQADLHAKSLKDQQYFYEEEKRCLNERYINGEITHFEYTRSLEDAELDYLQNVVNIYKEGSAEYLTAVENFRNREFEIQKKRFDENKKLQDQIKKTFFTDAYNTSDKEEYSKAVAALDVVYAQLSAQAATNEERLKIDKAYHEAKYALAKEYNQTEVMETLSAYRAMGDKIADFFQSDMGKNLKKGFDESVNQMKNLFSGLSDFIDAETDLQTKNIEKEYDKRIEAAGKESAEGQRLEKEKKAEIAKVNAEAAKKKFNMQVIETVATGIQSAVQAWSAGWQAGLAGVVLAPLFMAMSLATTGIQIAALKKQRDAAAAEGYAEGGYTRPGGKYEPAGIVHAGEWVASQELLANPTAAATIAALDEAQRTNTIGRLSKPSSTDIAQKVHGHSAESPRTSAQVSSSESDVLRKLNKRLEEPIYATTTLTGNRGLVRAQRRYEQLLRNKGKS